MGQLKIVCISDTHGYHGGVYAPDGDVLVHAGDYSMAGRDSETKSFLGWLDVQPHRHKVLIAGNHDLDCQSYPEKFKSYLDVLAPGVTYLNEESIAINGVKFFGSPWTPWFYDWAFNAARGKECKKHWDKIPQDTDVLVTHGPPRGHLDCCPKPMGCDDLLAAVIDIKPRLHVFGHIHEGYGSRLGANAIITPTAIKQTLFVNASICNAAYRPINKPIVVEI